MKFYCLCIMLALNCFTIPLVIAKNPQDQTVLTLSLDISEGGSVSKRNIKKLENYLKSNQCQLKLTSGFLSPKEFQNNSKTTPTFYFVPLNGSSGKMTSLSLALAIETYSGKSIQPSVVVRKNTIQSVDGLKDMNISIVEKNAKSGGLGWIQSRVPNLKDTKLLQASNHMAALSLLLHKDAFAAIIDKGFAEQWIEKNDLNLIHSGDVYSAGGIYANEAARLRLSTSLNAQKCMQAFVSLDRSSREHSRIMAVFPDWLKRFAIAE